jgi:phosphoesterase RecJ-like protein
MAEDIRCNLTLEALCAELLKLRRPIILMHTHPDADTVGSAFALAALLKKSGAEPKCICSDALPQRLEFLTLGNSDVAYSDGIECDGMIAVDIASPAQLGGLSGLSEKIGIMIDHHAKGDIFAEKYYISPEAAATGEIVFDMAKIIERQFGIDMDKDIAERLYAAISSDTGSFKYRNTTSATMMRAASLLEYGIDNAEISRKLFDCKSRAVLNAERLAYEKMQWLDNGRITAAVITNEDKAKYSLDDSDFATAIDIIRASQDAKISFVVKETTNTPGSYRVSMRSVGDLDVSVICAKFGGGGHKAAAGCNVTAQSPDAALDMILCEIMK